MNNGWVGLVGKPKLIQMDIYECIAIAKKRKEKQGDDRDKLGSDSGHDYKVL